MGVRQMLDENPKLGAAIAGGAVIAAIAVALVLRTGSGDSSTSAGSVGQAFFSIDDGQNWFADDASKIPPFQKDGKEAFRAYVYKCADKKPFVAWLGRYTPQAKQKIESIYASPPEKRNQLIIAQLELDALEVKRPGQTTWVKRSDPGANEVMMPRCPDGSYAEPVTP